MDTKLQEFYVCDACHGTFKKEWSDAEANEEAKRLHGVENASERLNDDQSIVCDDCFNAMRKRGLF